jgi:hypothetical protein
LLARSWDSCVKLHEMAEEELSVVAPLLIAGGCAGLAWRAVANSHIAQTPTAAILLDHYRDQNIKAALLEQGAERVFRALREAGIEPVLVKGWAVGRLYPELGLRPYSDVDICVPPGRGGDTEAVLYASFKETGWVNVDIHDGAAKLDTKNWEELFFRSRLVTLNETQVRVFSPEDHFRILCLHLLRHGAWRALWLCDVAVALETQAGEMDWDYCLTDEPRIATMICCVIGLARHLLKAEPRDLPERAATYNIPPWLSAAVIRQWDRCQNPNAQGVAIPTLLSKLKSPKRLCSDVYSRWDQPIRAMVELKGDFGSSARLIYQLAYLFLRFGEIPKQSVRRVRARPTNS